MNSFMELRLDGSLVLGVRGQRSGEGGFGLVLDSVEVVDRGFHRGGRPVLLQAERQAERHGRHLQRHAMSD